MAEVFFHALRAVISPVAPLFDAQAQQGEGLMTPLCAKALKRIFVMNDVDKVSLPFENSRLSGSHYCSATVDTTKQAPRTPDFMSLRVDPRTSKAWLNRGLLWLLVRLQVIESCILRSAGI